MHLLQGRKSDGGQTYISPMTSAYCLPCHTTFSCSKSSSFAAKAPNNKELLHCIQPSICQKPMGRQKSSEGGRVCCRSIRACVQTCKSHMCPLIVRRGPQPEEKHQISFIMCKASVKTRSKRQNPGLALPSQFHLNPVLKSEKPATCCN